MIDKNEAKRLGFKVMDSKKEQNPLYENLKSNFPQTINSDGVVSLKAIATLLGISERADVQGYELTFSGKGLANALYSTPCAKELFLNPKQSVSKYFHTNPKDSLILNPLKSKDSLILNPLASLNISTYHSATSPCHSKQSEVSLKDSKNISCHSEVLRSKAEESHNVESKRDSTQSGNTIIRGDNLDVLKLLKSAYSEKIKMIYIDPPYNTKNDNFIYPDDFREDYNEILKEVGLLLENERGEWVETEALKFFKNITGSKSHSGWLCFMLPRLKLARDLLREDGVIFISIDDNEQANLKILCDEIFGEENFVGDFIRKTKSTTNDAKTGLNYQHEFLLCYAKDREFVNLLGGQKDLSKYKNPDNDPNGEWISSDPSAKRQTKTGYFPITNPYTGKEDYPPKGMDWRFSQNTLQKHIDEGRICFKKEHKENERGFIYKRYLKELKTHQKTFDSLKFTENSFMNQSATKELLALGMGEYFTYPKGVDFIKEILRHSTNPNNDFDEERQESKHLDTSHLSMTKRENYHTKPLGEESPCHSKQSEVSLKDSKNISCHSEVLRSKAEESHNVESKRDSTQSGNTIIRGDNLDVLKLLKSAYSEKIKMIYIDPPYNTKNDNFIYPDDFREDYNEILKEVGLLLENERGEWVETEALKFFKNITGSKSHSGWLCFMLPRLKLARDLLREDGVIFISIDDNEQANLKILCDEIFGEENFVSSFVWQKKSGGGQATLFYEGHEYILIYAKDKTLMQGLFKVKDKSKNIETDFLRKIHGKYTNNSKLKAMYEKYPSKLIEHRNLMFEEMDIFLQEKMITQEKYNEIKQNLVNGTYFLKPYNDDFNLVCRYNVKNQSLMYSIISGVWTSDGNTEIENIFGYDDIFNDPKPTVFLKQLIQSVTINQNNEHLRGGGYAS